MSEFHYVRTLGNDGGVDACEGPAIGLDLETVLAEGLPPWRVALEIIAALCEILDIADEDGEIHGDVHPRHVFIDETGAVSLEGFGIDRSRTRAPEGAPKDSRSDLYGLGYTAYCTISAYPLPEKLPDDDPDHHDDAIIDAALEIDLSEVPDDMQGDVQWFVAKLMSFDREDRPSAVEAWRTFVAFASEIEGPDVADWCAAALDGGGARRAGVPPARGDSGEIPDQPEPTDEEDLGGPLVARGPLSGNKIAFDDGGSQPNKGATAFWTRDQMKKALDRAAVEADTHDEGPPMGAGGGSATSFWSRDQLDAMARGDQAAPRPRRAEGEGERRKATAAQRIPEHVQQRRAAAAAATHGPSEPPPAHPPLPPPSPPQQPIHPHQPLPPPSPPQHPPARASNPAPVTERPAETWEEPYPVPPTEDGGGGLRFVLFGGGIAAFGAALVAIVLVVLIVVLIVVSSSGSGTVVVPSPTPAPSPTTPAVILPAPVRPEPAPPAQDPPTQPAPPPASDPQPTPLPARPKPTPTPRPQPTTRPKPPPRPQPPRPAPTAPTSPGGDARVQLRSGGRGRVTGCTSSAKEFDGIGTFMIEGYKLPATCLVEIDGARGVFQVEASGDVACDRQGSAVLCDKTVVR